MNRARILHPHTDAAEIESLKETAQIVDTYDEQLEELFETEVPTALFAKDKNEQLNIWKQKRTNDGGMWVHYPWHNTLVHILSQENFKSVKNSRNHNIITPDEQEVFSKTTIGFTGLSVGNPGAVCTALEGGGKHYKLADFDTLSLSNLNRFRAGLHNLGKSKAMLTAQHVAEIDPFIEIELYEQGITKENIDAFLLEPKIDILVEEMDNLPMKLLVREKARKHGIPVIMVTGNGAGLVMDVERFDKEPDLPFLSGALPQPVVDGIALLTSGRKEEAPNILTLARDFMGTVHTKRLWDSFDEMGKTLAGIPQIAEATFLRGAALCHMIRRIVVHDNIKSGRYLLQLEDIISATK